jgi:hypothetical protein
VFRNISAWLLASLLVAAASTGRSAPTDDDVIDFESSATAVRASISDEDTGNPFLDDEPEPRPGDAAEEADDLADAIDFSDTYETYEPLVEDTNQAHFGLLPKSWWVRAEYLLWFVKGNRLPPLVTTSPFDTDREQAGVLNRDGTRILFGDQRVDGSLRHGGRFTIGHWLDSYQSLGVEVSMMGLSGDDTHYQAASQGNPILARPFFNTFLNEQDAALIAYPEVILGSIDIRTSSEMYSGSALLRQRWLYSPCARIDLLGGYRYFRYREGLAIHEDLVSVDEDSDVEIGTTLDVFDGVSAETDFHGGEIGLATEFFHGPFSLSAVTKLGLGWVRQRVDIDGGITVTTPGDEPVNATGGLLALEGTNIGSYTRDRYALLPELDLTLNYQVSRCLALSVGYTLLFLTESVRAGDQIDPRVNPTYIPGSRIPPTGTPRPSPRLPSTSIWAQGVNIGGVLEF